MKTFLIIIAICVASSSFAQIEKGRSYLSGQVDGGGGKTDYDNPDLNDQKQSSFGLNLSYGYLVADTWAVALSVSGGTNTSTGANQYKSTGRDYGVSPYVRKYFSIAEKFYFHLDGGVNYSTEKSTYKTPTSPTSVDYNAKTTSVYIRPGLTYFLSNRFSLNANLGSLNYSHSRATGDSYNNSTKNGFNSYFGLSSISFGASIFF